MGEAQVDCKSASAGDPERYRNEVELGLRRMRDLRVAAATIWSGLYGP
jgi:hypothetical protein